MFIRHFLIISILFISFWPRTYAFSDPSGDQTEALPSIFDSFYSDDALTVTLTTDLDALINDRKREDYQDAEFTYQDESGQERNWTIKVKPRGKYRRRICDFPPVKMKFPKEDLSTAGFNGHNDLKLVTHCLDDKMEALDNLMREYLAYKMYSLLTPNSYRVQLVKIQYKDGEGNIRPIKRYGFILEDTDEMAERLGGAECDTCINPDLNRMDSREENLFSVFQYMIGNADWSMMMARNVKFVERPSGQLLPVPFDFDFSGLVGAGYALPNTDYGQWHIESRIFMGFEPRKEVLFYTLSIFEKRKADLYAEVIRQKRLGKNTRTFICEYLDRFFDIIENGTEEQILSTFIPAKMNVSLAPDMSDRSGG